jgi:hypothetical protein
MGASIYPKNNERKRKRKLQKQVEAMERNAAYQLLSDKEKQRRNPKKYQGAAD